MKTPMSVSINMGSGCNFRCKYCFEVKNGAVEKSESIPQNVFDRIIEVLHELAEVNELRIEFWGGEPTVYFDKIKKIISEFYDNKDVSFFMYTNGSLVQAYKNDLLEIKEHVGRRLQIQVSYDYHNIENNQRIQLNHGAEETDKMVREAIKWFDENDFYVGTKSTCTINDLEEHLFEQYLNFEKLNKELKKKIPFALTPDTLNVGNVDYNKMNNQFIKLIRYFLKNKEFGQTGFLWFDQPNSNADCSGGYNSFQIDLNGDVSYCHGCLYGKQDLVYTNIFEDNFLHKVDCNYLVANNMFKKNEKCSNCESIFCFRCNALNSNGKKEHWNNSNKEDVCKLYNKISDYIKAYYKLTH